MRCKQVAAKTFLNIIVLEHLNNIQVTMEADKYNLSCSSVFGKEQKFCSTPKHVLRAIFFRSLFILMASVVKWTKSHWEWHNAVGGGEKFLSFYGNRYHFIGIVSI